MVIEVVSWKGAAKTHALNQHRYRFTLCGLWAKDGWTHQGDFPTCLRCAIAVMKS